MPMRRANTFLGNNNKRVVTTIVVFAFLSHVRFECVADVFSSSRSLLRLNERATAKAILLSICIV